MNLPICIGQNSSNQAHRVDLCGLPHVFLSYTEAGQSHRLFRHWISGLPKNNIQTLLGSSNAGATDFNFSSLVPGGSAPDRNQFFSILEKELKQRQKNQGPRPYLLVWMDDVIDLVITHKKKTGALFLKLLLQGPALHIHLVAASSASYKNLLQQLIDVPVEIRNRFLKPAPGETFSRQALGAELVLSGDDMVYFKTVGSPDYLRLYPVGMEVLAPRSEVTN